MAIFWGKSIGIYTKKRCPMRLGWIRTLNILVLVLGVQNKRPYGYKPLRRNPTPALCACTNNYIDSYFKR